MAAFIRCLEEIRRWDQELVGAKAANLGELAGAGFSVPAGFCVTAEAYRCFLRESGAGERIRKLLDLIKPKELSPAEVRAAQIRRLFFERPFPAGVYQELLAACEKLGQRIGEANPAVVVRSSALDQDSAAESFASPFHFSVNIAGPAKLVEHVLLCWASLWTTNAIRYREQHSGDAFGAAVAVLMQRLVPAEVAGVVYTVDPVSGDQDRMVVESAWGLGEGMRGDKGPKDRFLLSRQDLRLVERSIADKRSMHQADPASGTRLVTVPLERQSVPSLEEDQVRQVAELARNIEAHMGAPQDVEWAMSERTFFVIQSHPRL